MIFPLTHDRATVGTMPWVTLGIVLACFLTFLATRPSAGEIERIETTQRKALEYWLERPYLEPHPDLVPPSTRDLVAVGETAPTGTDVGREQRNLDALTASWRARLEDHPVWQGGLVPAAPRPSRLLTHMFHHAGWLHLLGNMLFLYLTAPFVEDVLGSARFAALYLVSGTLAGGLFALQYRDLALPLVGASGAVAGVMGAFLLFHGRARMRFLVFLGIAVGTFAAPAWVMLPLWFFGELLAALAGDVAAPAGGGGVAYWAHVWGFVAGLGMAVFWKRREPGLALAAAGSGLGVAERADPALARAREDVGRGIYPRAWRTLDQALQRLPHDPDLLDLYWQVAELLDRRDEAAPRLEAHARKCIENGDAVAAAAWLAALARAGAPTGARAALELRVAEALVAGAERGEAAQALRRLAGAGELSPGMDRRRQLLAAELAPELAAAATASRG